MTSKTRARPVAFVWASAAGITLTLLACSLLSVLLWPGPPGQAAAPGPARWPTARPVTRTPTPPYPTAALIPTPPRTVRPPSPPAGAPTALPTPERPRLLPPEDFAAAAEALAEAIAELNRAELRFLRDTAPDEAQSDRLAVALSVLDAELAEVVARAMSVARAAESLGFTAAAQDGGSAVAARMAEQYNAIARLGYAWVIEAQNARDDLAAGTAARAEVAATVAEYGARLWNPAVTDPDVAGNPFLPRLKDGAAVAPIRMLDESGLAAIKAGPDAGGDAGTWLATSQETVAAEVRLPAPLAELDDDRRAAADALGRLTGAAGDPAAPGAVLRVPLFKSAAVAGTEQVAAGVVPSFDRGTGSLLAKGASILGPAVDLVDDLFELGEGAPELAGQAPVNATAPLVTLSIKNVKVMKVSPAPDGSGSYDVSVEGDVAWQTTGLTPPSFELYCYQGEKRRITAASGSIRSTWTQRFDDLPAKGVLDCACEMVSSDTTIVRSFRVIGSAQASFFVGDQTQATQTAAAVQTKQAQTDTAVRQTMEAANQTNTAAAHATATARVQQTSAAQTAAAQATATARALGTEVAATQTAEFRATVTAIARQTEAAGQAGTFTLNGTFSLSRGGGDDPCQPGVKTTSGTLNITVNLATRTATGTLSGGGGSNRSALVCNGLTYDANCSLTYNATTLSGSVDPTSGALTLSGALTGKGPCLFQNCKQGDQPWDCGPNGEATVSETVKVTGVVDLAGRTARGSITSCPACAGDWSAG